MLAGFAYEAVQLFVRALVHCSEQGLDPYAGEELTNALRNTSFTGLFGEVTLDSNGDRALPQSILNVQTAGSLVEVPARDHAHHMYT